MKVIQDHSYIGECKCKACGATLQVERNDLKLKQGGLLGLYEIAYIECAN